MNDDVIVATYVILAEVLGHAGHGDHPLVQGSDAEVLTGAVVAAAACQNHHARALQVLHGLRSLSGRLSVSRFNRRLHALAAWLAGLLGLLGERFATGEAFLLDSLPVPVCRRGRARRCRKVRGKTSGGDCAAKRERCFGWRLPLVTPVAGIPVAFAILPAAWPDLTPVHDLTVGRPPAASTDGDKTDNSAKDEASLLADTGVRLAPRRKANMAPNLWADRLALRAHRPRIETSTSQLAAMGIQRLRARPNPGFELKVHASLFALAIINAC
jgi:hypothetical protein